MKLTKRLSSQKGFVVFVVAASAMVLIPVAGLGIDAAMLYVVKARLSAACDGAALAAARNLNVGKTMTAQEASARLRAESFYSGNFAEGYLGAHRNAPVITIPMAAVGNVLQVTTDGSARFIPYFMKYLGINSVDVRATGTAARRDVNIMLVLDRSLSMDNTNSCEPMKAAARNFVDRFVEGRDRLGLITFGSTIYRVAPSRNFKTASPNLDTLISQIDCDGTTNMVTAYWRAYQEIISLAQPGALNIIVLFTDGIPNGFYANFPIKTVADTRYGYSGGPCGSGSTCTVAASSCTVASPLTGVVSHYSAVGSSLTGETRGLTGLNATSITNHNETYASGTNGCAFRSSLLEVRRDVAYLPDQDYYGNRTRGGPNQYRSFLTSGAGNDMSPGFPGQLRVDRPSTIMKASSNAMDHAAQRLRARELDASIGIVTFVIGLGDPAAADPPDDVLMRRVANDPASALFVHDPLLPDGKYLRANDNAGIAGAFAEIGSEVLRIAH